MPLAKKRAAAAAAVSTTTDELSPVVPSAEGAVVVDYPVDFPDNYPVDYDDDYDDDSNGGSSGSSERSYGPSPPEAPGLYAMVADLWGSAVPGIEEKFQGVRISIASMANPATTKATYLELVERMIEEFGMALLDVGKPPGAGRYLLAVKACDYQPHGVGVTEGYLVQSHGHPETPVAALAYAVQHRSRDFDPRANLNEDFEAMEMNDAVPVTLDKAYECWRALRGDRVFATLSIGGLGRNDVREVTLRCTWDAMGSDEPPIARLGPEPVIAKRFKRLPRPQRPGPFAGEIEAVGYKIARVEMEKQSAKVFTEGILQRVTSGLSTRTTAGGDRLAAACKRTEFWRFDNKGAGYIGKVVTPELASVALAHQFQSAGRRVHILDEDFIAMERTGIVIPALRMAYQLWRTSQANRLTVTLTISPPSICGDRKFVFQYRGNEEEAYEPEPPTALPPKPADTSKPTGRKPAKRGPRDVGVIVKGS